MRKLRKILGTLVLVVILVEVVLVLSGVLDLLSAVKIVVLIELSLAGFVIFEIYVIAKAVRSAKASGEDLPFALDLSFSDFFPASLARYLRQDFMLLRAIWMLVTGRRDVDEDERAMPYSSPLVYMLSAIAVVDGLVVVALHMLLPGWIRTVALILGILGFIWLVGFIASLIVYPHVVGEHRLRLRFSVFHDIIIPLDAIRQVQAFGGDPGSTNSAANFDGKLVMVVTNQANLRVLTQDIENLKTLSPKLADEPISGIIFYTDDKAQAHQWLETCAAK